MQHFVNYASVLSTIIAIVAFPLIWRQLRAANVANGLATLHFLQESIHKISEDLNNLKRSQTYANENEKQKDYIAHIQRIMNVLESGCAVVLARSLTRKIENSVVDSIDSILDTLNKSEECICAIRSSISYPTDYSNIREYISETNKYYNVRAVLSDQLIKAAPRQRYMPWLRY